MPLLGDALNKSFIGEGAFADSGAQEAPEVVVVPGHAEVPRLVGGTKGFLMKKTGFFPKRPFGGENAKREGRIRIESGEVFCYVRLNCFVLMRPVVRSGAEFDLYHWAHITSGSNGEYGLIMEEEALAVGHFRINLQSPTGFSESGFQAVN